MGLNTEKGMKLHKGVSQQTFNLMQALDNISNIPTDIDKNSRYLML